MRHLSTAFMLISIILVSTVANAADKYTLSGVSDNVTINLETEMVLQKQNNAD